MAASEYSLAAAPSTVPERESPTCHPAMAASEYSLAAAPSTGPAACAVNIVNVSPQSQPAAPPAGALSLTPSPPPAAKVAAAAAAAAAANRHHVNNHSLGIVRHLAPFEDVDLIKPAIIVPAGHIVAVHSDGLDLKPAPHQGNSTFMQATFNCVSLLYGLGILSSPYAVAKAGWAGVLISLLVSSSYAYTAYLMSECVKDNPKCSNYQDVAKLAFGKKARKIINALFYIEITGTLVGYCISVGDNLAYIFPNVSFSLPGLSNRNFMIFVASLIMLPSVWLRDLSALSFTSMWCIASTVILLIAVLLVATVNHVGFTHPIPFLHIQGVPVAAGLYAFSYGGTSVFPSICKSMKEPSKFPQVLIISFAIATTSIAGLGVIGAYMFGYETRSQITLSMPIHFLSTKIVLWMTVVTPMFKFALQLSPITIALERQLNKRCKASTTMLFGMGTLMRSTVLAMIAIVSMVFPYFEYIVALVGSSMTIAICMIFPCVFYMKLNWGVLKRRTIGSIGVLVLVGVIVGIYGTIVAIEGLINKRRNQSS